MRIRIYHLLAACNRDYEVTFISPKPCDEAGKAHLERVCSRTIFLEEAHSEQTGFRQMLERFKKSGIIRHPAFLPTLNAFEQALSKVDLNAFDLIWVEKQAILPLIKAHHSKTIVDFDDVAHVKNLREARLKLPSKQGLVALQRGVRSIYAETLGTKKYLSCIVCSNEDRQYLHSRGAKNVHAIPNGTELPQQRAKSTEGTNITGPKLVFLGNMGYDPNRDAVDFFCSAIEPLLKVALPDFELDVIGPGATEELQHKYRGSVRFLGFVDDLPQALSEYDIFIAPLRYGSGTKLKLLDAMANRLPIVTTPIGAEGLHLEHGKSGLIVETAEEIAASVVKLYENHLLAGELTRNAFDVVNTFFRWESIRELAADWIRETEIAQKLAQNK